MDQQVLEAIRDMMTTHRVLSLAVLVDNEPEASLLPYAVRPDYGAVYIQASGASFSWIRTPTRASGWRPREWRARPDACT